MICLCSNKGGRHHPIWVPPSLPLYPSIPFNFVLNPSTFRGQERMIPAHLPIRISLLLLPLFLLSHYSIAADSSQSSSLDPCKRQPFRGRCPAGPNGVQMRSQFVLRYYLRNGECISYPYGHCVNDDNEPRLYRYKEECEDACLGGGGGQRGENGGGDGGREATYATIGPILGKDQTGKPPTKAGDAGGKEETECQRQQRGDNETAGGQREYAFIPECTVDGQFRPLQCEKQPNGECFCVNKSGNELKYSRAKSDQQQKIDCERIASAQSALVQECTGSAEPGPCTGSIQRWHFHQPSGQCRPFNFSGCGANGNNFGSEQSCAQQCIHEQPKCDGGQLPLKDSQGQVVGCGTVNCPPGFLCQANAICCPELASEATQSPPPTEVAGNLVLDKKTVGEGGGGGDVCAMPKDRGPCDQYQMRFYFNRELGECKYFFYGGCEGNGNNFARVEECERACLKKGGHSAELVTTTTTTTSMGTTTTGGAGGEEEEAKKRRTTIGEATTTTGISSSPLAREFVDVEPEPVQSNLASDLDTARNVQRVQPPAPILPANRCQHTKDPGNCAAQFVRWFWNGEARICESFAYTGCQGNGNNFASREECLSICHREVVDIEENVDPLKNICDSEIDPGQCGGIFMRYGFDRRSGECRQFQYGGCGGNGNNFASLADCRRKCVGQPAGEEEEEDHQEGGHQSAKTTLLPSLSPNICEHRMDPGECTGTFQRFGYDQKANRCTKFVYGGCGGNGNNFATIDDCSSACVRVQCRPEPECDLGRCQLVRDGQGCPLCSCPPPRHPPLAPTPPRPDEAAHGQCPPLNVQLCQEPCIIFLNRRGCRECVCPIMPAAANTPIQATPPAPSDSVSMPKSSPRTAPPPPPPLPSQNGPQSPIVAPVAPIPKILGGVSNNAVDALPPPTIPPPPPPPSSSPSPPPPPLPSSAIHQGTVEPIAFGHNEICSQPLDAGASACLRFVQRWFFNADSGHCEPFTYTGCAGNRNHFFSKKECQIYCARFSRNMAAEGSPVPLPDGEKHSAPPPPSTPPFISAPIHQHNHVPNGVVVPNTISPLAPSKIAPPPPPPPFLRPSPLDDGNELLDQDAHQQQPIVPDERDEARGAPMILQPIDPNVRLESRIVPEMGRRGREEEEEEEGEEEEEEKQQQRRGQQEVVQKAAQRPILRIGVPTTETLSLASRTTSTTTNITTSTSSMSIPSTTTQIAPSNMGGEVPKAKQMLGEEREEELRGEGGGTTRGQQHMMNTTTNTIQIPSDHGERREEKEEEGEEGRRANEETAPEGGTTIGGGENGRKGEEEEMEGRGSSGGANESNGTFGGQQERGPILGGPSPSVEEEGRKKKEEEDEKRKEEEETKGTTPDDLIWVEMKKGRREGGGGGGPIKGRDEPREEGGEGKIVDGAEREEGKTTMVVEEEEEEVGNGTMAGDGRGQTGEGGGTLSTLFTSHHIGTEKVVEEEEGGAGGKAAEEVMRQVVPVWGGLIEEGQPMASITKEEEEGEEKEQRGGGGGGTKSSTPPQQQLIALTNASSSSVSPSPSSIVLVPSTLPPVPHPPPPPLSPAVHSPPPVDHHIGLPLLSQQQICSLLPDAGPCQQFVPRWFFNIKSGQCEQFSFGSCRGNPNNFPDRARCEAACHPPLPIGQKVVVNRCIVDKDEGTGGGYNVHWYFNVRNLRCEQFVWQGSGGNDNRFGTEAECKMACARGEGGQETVPAAPELLPRPRNVVPPSQVVDREEAEERSNRVEQQPTIMVQGAPIARTRDMEGNVGMPAPAELIPEEMPSPSPSTLAPPPLPAAMAPNPSSPPSRTSAYSADPLPKVPPKMPENLPPMLGNSPPATIDYRNNIRLPSADAGGHQDSAAVAHGLPNHVPESGKFDEVFGGPKEGGLLSFGPKQSVHLPGVPVCPNGLNAMQYSDGRPVLCLPGMGQCPDKSVCYFNGLDFFCCPNEDDPYDQHVFGGYDGEESKHGYKVGTGLRARLRRQADMGGGFGNSLRFDDKPPPVPQSQARYADSASSSPCDQPLFKGTCQQAILRFFYEPASGRCRHFHFTGCGGNQNNFGTLADCEKTCKKAEEQGGDASPPAPKGPCPGGHLPLGGRNPVLCGDLLDSIGCPAGFICIPGPPSVCCPSSVAESAEIRRKPSIAEPGQMEVQPAFQEASTKKAGGASIAEMNAQLLLCQDGSDPMRNETSGIVVECGAGMGIDGRALCEPGFYCSIDPERNVRFCCPLQAQGAKLGTNSAELLAPHFGRRTPNPGEVLGKGSLPSDQQQRTSRKLGGARHGPAGIGGVGTTEFGHLRLRAARVGKEGEGEESQKLMEPKGLDWPTSEDPFEGIACLQRPAEGRECAKGEPSARSNLQHFYSPADRRCKAFFYRGCGGNGNRFETKAECEKRCGGRR